MNAPPPAAAHHPTFHEDVLRRAALAVSGAGGPGVLGDLVRDLAEILAVDVAFIAVFTDERRTHMRTLAAQLDGRKLRGFEYPLAGSPCEKVVGREFRLVPSGVRPEFPPGTMFGAVGMDAYAAYPLHDGTQCPLGLIAVMNRAPIGNGPLVEAVLKIFAIRSVGEIERLRSEAALRNSEASYRAIFEASEDPIFVHDWDTGAILDASPKATEIYGRSREELLHASVADVSANVPPYTEADALQHIERAKVEGPIQFHWRARHRSGRLMWHEVRLKPAVIAGEKRVLAYTRDITDRKEAEEALRGSEEQYRAIFNASVDGLILMDADHRIVDVNEASLSMHGYRRDEMIGRRLAEFIPDDMQARCEALLPGILAGEPCHIGARTQRRDGSLFDVEIHGVPMHYQGRPHALVIMRNVTESKRAEKQLRDSEKRYRLLFETESDAILLVDVSTLRLIDANPAAEGLWGYDRAELLGLTVDDLSAEPAESRASVQLPTGRVHIPLRLHRKRDGTVFPVEITANRLTLDGRLTVVAAVRDITDRKAAEEALRASEEQYRAIFNASADALVLRDARFRIVDVNATYERMSGYTRAEVLGVDRVLANPPETRGALRALHDRALAGEPVLLETQLVRRDGLCRELELRAVPVQHRGEPHVLWVGRDITERKRADAERERLEAQLRQAQKMEAIGHLTGGIAHDFNNILTSVMGYVVLAAERDAVATDPKTADYLEQAQASCRRARDLIQQLLTFSRGKRAARRAAQAAPLLEESAKLLRSSLPASVELVVDAAPDLPDVAVDAVQVEQVLLNLAINARDAMGGQGVLWVTARRTIVGDGNCASCRKPLAGDYLQISVRDTGPGIAPDVLDRMFEPFFSTKDVGKGSGMGLAIVHGIVHEHGGHVLVASAPGRGAEFRVLLPALAATERPRDADAVPSDRARQRKRLAGRVMIVDDEASVLEFMRERLSTWGIEVMAHGNPVEAFDLLRRDPDAIDLLVTDQCMPRLTGTDLAREVLALRPALPVLLYSGHADEVSEPDALAMGVRGILRKPVDLEDLYALLERSLPRA